MSTSLSNITVNGVPLERVIDEEVRQEIRSNHQDEVKSLSFVKSRHFSTSSFRNHSGARSGKCRIIYSAGGQA